MYKPDAYTVLHSPFNVATHKMTFVNYLEVVILEDGTIEYAVPSHQEKLLEVLAAKRSQTRNEVYESCPREYWFDMLEWLTRETGAVSVWGYTYVGTLNRRQRFSLRLLQKSGLYTGMI